MANTASFSGNLKFDGLSYPLKGKFVSGTFSGSFVKMPLPVSLSLVEINSGNYFLSGTAGGQPFTALHAAYGYARAAAEAGRYTVSLSATDTNLTIPQNTSSASLSVGESGGALLGGKLPDGETFRASGVLILSPSGNQFLIYQSLN